MRIKRPTLTVVCRCGKEFQTRIPTAQFCSIRCRADKQLEEHRGRSPKHPLRHVICYCGKELNTYRPDQEFCSRSCAAKKQYADGHNPGSYERTEEHRAEVGRLSSIRNAGEGNPNFKHGDRWRQSQWLKAVAELVGWDCWLCETDSPTAKLQAHHIYSVRLYPELEFEPRNGVILCTECHPLVEHHPEWFKREFLLVELGITVREDNRRALKSEKIIIANRRRAGEKRSPEICARRSEIAKAMWLRRREHWNIK